MRTGEALGMNGPNGAGKSTCIRLLLDFIRPDSGSIKIFGQSPKDPTIRQHIGYLPEVANFPQNVSCMDMMRFAGRSCQMRTESIAVTSETWLKRLGLWEDRNRRLRTYSKGMLQRTSFAMALIHNPELLVLDETMSGLDPIGRADIVTLIQELKERGKTILFCSHLLEDVERLVDRLIVLHQGRILFTGDLNSMKSKGGGSLEKGFISLIDGSR